MKKWIRITSVVFVLVGGTAFFGYQSLSQFNSELDNLSASYIALASTPTYPSGRLSQEAATTTPEGLSTATSSTAMNLSLALPKEAADVFVGCTYTIALQSSTSVQTLELALVDASTSEAVGPIASGLPKERKIEPDTQSLDWKVGSVWPGEYLISVSKMNGLDTKAESKAFAIRKLSDDVSATKREKICKDSGGSLQK